MKPRLPECVVTMTRAPAALRRLQLAEPESRHERMDVDDIRTPAAQPVVELLGSPCRDEPLDFLACRTTGDRVTVDVDPVVLVAALVRDRRIGRGDDDIGAGCAQASGQGGDIHLGAAEALREVPPERLNDPHARGRLEAMDGSRERVQSGITY